ncbi:ATP-binding protein [Actinomadura sp. NPDC048955]|uniref:ATP-binding protein n=1 Tax=Actinomadura sp. NPDC048955 TaxID=3158228 RepID=UPI0034020CF6
MSARAVADHGLDTAFLAAWTAPAQVRMQLSLRLASWGMAGITGDVALIASELVTNAVRHAGDGEIRVRFTREARGVLLEVWDACDRRPVCRRPAPSADAPPRTPAPDPGYDYGMGGRGLLIVEELAAQCGVVPTEPRGKWVWARVAL